MLRGFFSKRLFGKGPILDLYKKNWMKISKIGRDFAIFEKLVLNWPISLKRARADSVVIPIKVGHSIARLNDLVVWE